MTDAAETTPRAESQPPVSPAAAVPTNASDAAGAARAIRGHSVRYHLDNASLERIQNSTGSE